MVIFSTCSNGLFILGIICKCQNFACLIDYKHVKPHRALALMLITNDISRLMKPSISQLIFYHPTRKNDQNIDRIDQKNDQIDHIDIIHSSGLKLLKLNQLCSNNSTTERIRIKILNQ
jgi:hypothetical protein